MFDGKQRSGASEASFAGTIHGSDLAGFFSCIVDALIFIRQGTWCLAMEI
jgi:hypothetical protein